MPDTPTPVRFSQSARRHKIGRAHVLHIINNHKPIETRNRRYWLEEDATGSLLEVIAVVTADHILVIHAMPFALRERNQP